MDRIRAGLVGTGWMGGTLLKRLSERDDVDVLAVCEPNADRGREALKAAGLPASVLVTDYDEIVRNPDIDAVWVISPNSFHAKQSLAAMKAGKHVFSEKPCATTFREYQELIEAERANPGLVTYTDYILYFDSMEERLRGMVADGVFGTISQVQVNYRHPINIAGEKIWKLDKSIMGDAIGMGINHALSVMIYIMQSQAKPVSVYATSMPAQVREFEADPIWNILVKFDNGAAGFCFGNIDNGNGYDAYHNLQGSSGGFTFESQIERSHKVRYWSTKTTDGKWVHPLDRERCVRERQSDLAWADDTTTPDSGNVVEHQTSECINHFIECVKSGRKSPLSFVNSSIITDIGWAAQMSAGMNKPISLPLNWDEGSAFFGQNE